MIKILSLTITGMNYKVKFSVNGESHIAHTYFDNDGHDKIDFDGKTYELIDLSYLREV